MGKVLGIVFIIIVVIAVILGGFSYCNRETAPEIKKEVDLQYHRLSIKLVELEIPNDSNFAIIANQLDSIRWTPIEDGGRYEEAKKEMFVEEKKRIAVDLKEFFEKSNNSTAPRIIETPDEISE